MMPPLSKRIRVITLWVMVLLFIVGTPLLIGYSKGYRIGDALSLIETGGVYLHSDMAHTTVYLDGVFVEENGVLLKNTLIQDLRPNRIYEVWVEKEGYQSWTKELVVRPNLVTEGAVLMLPTAFSWATVTPTTTVAITSATTSSATTTAVANPLFMEFTELFAADKDQFAVEVATSTHVFKRGIRIATTTTVIEMQFPEWLDDLASTSRLATKNMVRERDGIVAWLDGGDLYATWARKNDIPPYYFCNATCTPMLVIDWDEDISRYSFYPNRNDVVVVQSTRGIYAVELDNRSQRNIQPFLEEPHLNFRLQSDDSLVVFDGTTYRETSW